MQHRWIARALVVGLHALVLALLWLHRGPALHAPEASAIRMRIVVPVPPPQPRSPPPPPPAPPAKPPALAARVIPAPAVSVATPDTEDTAAAIATPAPESTAPAAPAAAPRTTLRLTLPPGWAASSAAARNPALSDPRSNTPRLTFEDRIANAAAVTGDWVAERTSDGRMRYRRGDTCVETQESRIASIDRFNQSVAPRAAAMTGRPYKCR